MQETLYLPHIDLLLQSMRINRDRLNSRSKIAVDAKLLRTLLQRIVMQLPFSAEFYETTYPDIGEAAAAGKIPDLHRHFVETGFFEGRLGCAVEVDEEFYTGLYKDVALAVQRGDVVSGADHYMRSGAAEGRIPNPALKPEIDVWTGILRVTGAGES